MTDRQKTERCYCITLRRAAKAMTDYYDRCLTPVHMTVNQYALLMNIAAKEPCSVNTLARAMRLERTTLVRNMKPLFAAGLVGDDPLEGSRVRPLSLTDAGRAALETAGPLWEKTQTDIKGIIGEEAFSTFMETMVRLQRL
jgi:DNA-binding MarR family transcriptional regulator